MMSIRLAINPFVHAVPLSLHWFISILGYEYPPISGLPRGPAEIEIWREASRSGLCYWTGAASFGTIEPIFQRRMFVLISSIRYGTASRPRTSTRLISATTSSIWAMTSSKIETHLTLHSSKPISSTIPLPWSKPSPIRWIL